MMALDKMIKEANDIGGAMVDSIVLDQKEALGLILEVLNLGNKYKPVSSFRVTDLDGVDITSARTIVWNGTSIDKNDHAKNFVNSWYRLHFKVKYDGIPVVIVKPKLEVPSPEGWTDEPKQKAEVTVPRGVKIKKPLTKGKLLHGNGPPPVGWSERPPPPPPPPPPPLPRSVTGKPPEPPIYPPSRILSEGNIIGHCEKCGSSLKSKWLFFKASGCIQPECENYWKND